MNRFEQYSSHLKRRITEVTLEGKEDFEALALEVFGFQYEYNEVYRAFCDHIQRKPDTVRRIERIPFLPISTFRHRLIQTGDWKPEEIFESSGTSSARPSRQAIRDRGWYHRCATICFENRFGPVKDWCFLALLPSYLERSNASLVHMMDRFIERSRYSDSGFYLDDYDQLMQAVLKMKSEGVPTILFGVSFALYDLAERYEEELSGIILMETGGFKGRSPELSRDELHDILRRRFALDQIHSEYGMTELHSQAYSKGAGEFRDAPLMQPLIFEINDPLCPEEELGRTGRMHIIDLGNIDTCSFIATEDLGRRTGHNTFTVEGRLEGSMLRGCNLMWRDIKKEPE